MRLGDGKTIIDMPKLQSPLKRETNARGEYVCVPKIEDDLRWVFTEECTATEKLDGTNVSIIVKDGGIASMYNRKNPIAMWKLGNKRFVEGILEAIEKGYFDAEHGEDGQYFGELIGPLVNGNPYQLKTHGWLPLSLLRERYAFKFWDEFVKGLRGLNDEEIYGKTNDVFKGLWSLYKRRRGVQGKVDENVGFEGMAAEGIVFYRKSTNEMAKLRRDMFEFFKGRRHGQ